MMQDLACPMNSLPANSLPDAAAAHLNGKKPSSERPAIPATAAKARRRDRRCPATDESEKRCDWDLGVGTFRRG